MKNLFPLGVIVLLMSGVVSGYAQSQARRTSASTDKKPNNTDQAAGNDAANAQKSGSDDPTYLIGPDDQVDVSVWGEPTISRSVPVRPDGRISLPLLNDVQAAGLTPMQLGAEITAGLKKYIEAPQVTVIITRASSLHVFILGEVTRAGAYPLLPKMTVLAALSSAGGFSPFAKRSKVHILRTENGKQITIPFNYKEAVSGQHPEQNVILRAGDTIVVP